ncbi:hypothetical protein JBP901_gp030 [Bacillus phage JBP901]|uniref:Uncharacterized protein n=2 Tax=Caeruleovirus TaxID=1911929 RepID=A0A0E3DEQ2_9CAUD|nr:hypothetical protein JBP901_gp030 [Bacillus phage JBP901]YP_009149620.1 hypothetical protein BCP8-2_059 [Bacillus phage BCP8-2]AHJ87097.1 hypothetical protein BCP8-2_059 [Bacillus phage BCP8-2]AID17743.1 hypothetical protein JBP901_gp030 [Bacillus phage JBP901]
MGKTYFVAVPVVGKVIVEVEGATSEQDAIEKALEVDMSFDIESEDTTVWVEEWDRHERVVQGNVYYGVISDAHIDSVEDEDDE